MRRVYLAPPMIHCLLYLNAEATGGDVALASSVTYCGLRYSAQVDRFKALYALPDFQQRNRRNDACPVCVLKTGGTGHPPYRPR